MRFPIALALVFVACSADPTLPPRDCTPGQTSPCACPGGVIGVQACTAGGTLGACACPDGGSAADVVDASSPADAPALEDRPAPMDVVAAHDAVAAPDVVDAGAPRDAADVVDVDPRQTPECRGVTQVCDGRTVNVQLGERDGGLTYHCGRCGVTCGAAELCNGCICVRP